MFETIDKYMLSHVDIDDLAASVKYKRAFRKANPTYFEPDGILVFCGPQGSGKTLSAVRYVLDLLRAFPRAILCSNVRIHGLPESVRYVPYWILKQVYYQMPRRVKRVYSLGTLAVWSF